MTEGASQITSLTIVYSAVYSGRNQRKHQSSASLAFVRGIHRRPVNSPRKGPVMRKMFPFDDVIMIREIDCNIVSTLSASNSSPVNDINTCCNRFCSRLMVIYFLKDWIKMKIAFHFQHKPLDHNRCPARNWPSFRINSEIVWACLQLLAIWAK